MRKIILFIASSLDGFIAGKNGEIDWLFSDADYGYKKFYSSVDTVLVGRRTYEAALGLEKIPFESKKCFVFTSKEIKVKQNATVIPYAVSFTKKLLKRPGKNIWLVGGGEVVSDFLNNNLIDEIILSIHPIILGEGIPLFPKIKGKKDFALSSSGSFESGLVQLHYIVKK